MFWKKSKPIDPIHFFVMNARDIQLVQSSDEGVLLYFRYREKPVLLPGAEPKEILLHVEQMQTLDLLEDLEHVKGMLLEVARAVYGDDGEEGEGYMVH